MAVMPATKEELERLHFEALIGIVQDFLAWGGGAQAEQAERALAELGRRFNERKRAVQENPKLFAVI